MLKADCMHWYTSSYTNHPQILVSTGGPGANPLWTPRATKFLGIKSYTRIFSCIGAGVGAPNPPHCPGVNCIYIILSLFNFSVKVGVSKLCLMGQVWPTSYSCVACELRMVFTFLNSWEKRKRIILYDTWILCEIQISLYINKLYWNRAVLIHLLSGHFWEVTKVSSRDIRRGKSTDGPWLNHGLTYNFSILQRWKAIHFL